MRVPSGACLVLAVLLAACTVTREEPVPERQAVAEITMQAKDVQGAGLQRCSASGPIDAYLKSMKARGGPPYQDLAASWQRAQSAGADSAYVVVFVDDPALCSAGLIPTTGRSSASLAIRYPSSSAAATGWQRGILGLPTPSADQQSPGLLVGVATSLTRNSWSLDHGTGEPPTYLAFWQNGSFDILVVTTGLSVEQSRLAASAVSGRVR